MAEIQPAHFTQAECHTAQGDRQVLSSLAVSEGVAFGIGDALEVVDGPAGMQVTVGTGNAFVQGDTNGWQGMYHVSNNADVNLTLTAADPTDPRIDLIIAQVKDSQYAGPDDEWELMTVTGTPAPSPSTPAVPASALVLASVAVAAGATGITSADITDLRVPYTGTTTEPEVVRITSSGTFVKANYPGKRWARICGVGGGGQGAGSLSTGASESSVGSGGAAGEYRELTIALDDLADSETVSIGAGGTGASAGTGGLSGGDTSFGSHFTCAGGDGGNLTTAGSTDDAIEGVGPTTGGTGGDFNIPGGASLVAFRSGTSAAAYSSAGGDSVYGIGGRGRTTDGNGRNGEGKGSGGGGAKSGASSAVAHTGGDGTPGVIVIYLT